MSKMKPFSDWNEVASIPVLLPNQLHLIAAPLDVSLAIVNQLQTLLSSEENERADRFVFPIHKSRFIVCRGLLRFVLGSYLSGRPSAVIFQAEMHGKLRLADRSNSDIRFNLTHSEELAVFAFARSLQVGVDVEKVDTGRAVDEIANRYFSTRERMDLAAAPVDDRVEAFFRCWTRKEAYLKARGDGLSVVSLDSFDVTLLRNQEPRVSASDSRCWSIESFAPVTGWVGAVVFEGRSPNISKFYLRPSLTLLL